MKNPFIIYISINLTYKKLFSYQESFSTSLWMKQKPISGGTLNVEEHVLDYEFEHKTTSPVSVPMNIHYLNDKK